jgi:hypothetical protein
MILKKSSLINLLTRYVPMNFNTNTSISVYLLSRLKGLIMGIIISRSTLLLDCVFNNNQIIFNNTSTVDLIIP